MAHCKCISCVYRDLPDWCGVCSSCSGNEPYGNYEERTIMDEASNTEVGALRARVAELEAELVVLRQQVIDSDDDGYCPHCHEHLGTDYDGDVCDTCGKELHQLRDATKMTEPVSKEVDRA